MSVMTSPDMIDHGAAQETGPVSGTAADGPVVPSADQEPVVPSADEVEPVPSADDGPVIEQ